jgi:hypothetical protein
VHNTKISLERTTLEIKEELTPIFPNLLANGAEGMQQLSIKVDNENGQVLKSDKPLRVRTHPTSMPRPNLTYRSLAFSPEDRPLVDTM